MTIVLAVLASLLCIISLAAIAALGAAGFLLYRVEKTLRASRDDLRSIPALVEGLTRLTTDQVRLLGELRESVDRMHAAIFAGQGSTTGFTPYSEAEAAAAYAKHQAKADNPAGAPTW